MELIGKHESAAGGPGLDLKHINRAELTAAVSIATSSPIVSTAELWIIRPLGAVAGGKGGIAISIRK